MDVLLLLIYAGVATAIFKIFKIPLNKWTVPTAILGGFVFLFFLLYWMNFNHPYAKYAKEVYVSVPITPAVKGIVVDVPIEPNVEVEAGTVLFQIDQTPYRNEITRLEAALEDAKQADIEADAAVRVAEAVLKEAEAERDNAKLSYERYSESAGVSEIEKENRYQTSLAAEAMYIARQAELNQTKLAAAANVQGLDTTVAQIQAQLETARYNLDQTTVRAPSKGMVTQLALRKGTYATPLPLKPALVFVPTERRRVVASFWQNSLRVLEEGADAEVAFDAVPGKIFTGKLVEILPYVPEADFQFGGSLVSSEYIKSHDRVAAIIELDEDLNDYHLPIGLQAKAAILNHSDKLHSSPVRRILLRMMSWLNYLYPIKK
ncbi:HlyD family secretion protein [Coraliomargarita akajimensis]|uniref:Secretion protein HlyD family protein n=1 Tax=Coraliomargarita akajimensis (strain DSM 45221 / IAM 15411 / JCM 23193 / KCTC 12865 / 04OKA010-24) TaxID=583355 RepID=D5EPF1_CORAD|nr:HlyD family secretion protein [Coraliomargarita akajimensis]ADE53688.1 secretion protein HlyD family protein [Coraliomargarita akajimensis DSM 45221]